MNRRGSALDVLVIMVLAFAFGVGFLVMGYTANTMYTAVLNQSQIAESSATVEVLQAGQEQIQKLDLFFLALFIGLVLALIISAWFISSNPVFIGLYFIVIVIGVVVSMGLSNGWEEVSQRPVFASMLGMLPVANHILTYLPYYVAVLGMIGVIVVFAKPGFNPGGDL